MSILTNLGQFTQFNILDHVQNLEVIRETLTEIEVHCPLCHAKNFKIDKKTGRYYGFSCSCMDTEQGKNEIVKEIAPLPEEQSYYSPRPQAKSKAQEPSFDRVEPISLAKFEVIPTDFPQPSKPLYLPQGIPENAHQIDYRYSPTQFVSRFDWEDPSKAKGCDKSFRQCHVNQEGNLIWGKGNQPWPLYHESEVIAAKDWILFQEGEKCVDAARSLGLVSTTLQGSNWGEEGIAESLTRLKEAGLPGVVFVTDNDGTGRDKGKKVALVGSKIDFPVIVIHTIDLWPECPEKGDLANWITWGIAKGMNIQDFIERLETEIHAAVARRAALAVPLAGLETQPKKSQNNEVEEVKIQIKQWLLEDDPVARALIRSNICRVYGLDKKTFQAIAESLDENSSKPEAKRLKPHEFMALPTSGTPLLGLGIASMGVTIIAGNPGAGKTTLAYDLAGAVLMGDEFLGEVTSRQGSVLFVNCDEPHQWGQDKLINRGITNNYEVLMDWDVGQWTALEMTVEDMRPALVVVDSFNAIHHDPNFDENSAQASQTAKKLERLSAKYCVPIVLIHHLGKSKENKGVNKLRGSTAIAASVSSVLILEGEGPQKRLHQPKIRGSEPLDLTVEMDVENGRFKVVSGNITDDATKSVTQRLKDFYTANPGMYERTELSERFPDVDQKQLTNALNRLLGTVINGLPVIKRPSKINPRFKVYGLECTNDDNLSQSPPLSPPSPGVTFDDVTAETITVQESQQITTQSQLKSQPSHNQNDNDSIVTSETIIQTENHQITTESQPRGESVSPVSCDIDSVPPSESVTRPDSSPEPSPNKNEELANLDQNNIEPLEWNDVIEEMDSCIEALGWTKERARQYVQVTYGKKSRLKLTDDELLELLEYFRNLVRAKE